MTDAITPAYGLSATPSAPPESGLAPAIHAPGVAHVTPRRSFILWGIVAVLLLFIACYFLLPDLYEVRTDDAYVEVHLVSVIPKVPAYVKSLHVDDNSRVKSGDLLLELDPRDYVVQVDLAQANVEAARARAEEAQTQIEIARSNVRQSQAEVNVAQAASRLADVNLTRLQSVSDIRGVSTDRVDTAKATAESGHASLIAAEARHAAVASQVALAEAQLKTARAALAQSEAQLAQAQLNLSYTKIYAVDAGSIANKSVEQGNYVEPGQKLLSLVPEAPFVIANYKETQLTSMRPGQPAEISVDAFPGMKLQGHVESMQRGTGSRFALLPPENATGNFVKVVQRVPVKIVLDGPMEAIARVAPGMSVETKVFSGRRPAWLRILD